MRDMAARCKICPKCKTDYSWRPGFTYPEDYKNEPVLYACSLDPTEKYYTENELMELEMPAFCDEVKR